MKYEIELSLSQSKTITVEAESMSQAVEKAYDRHSTKEGWRIEAINDRMFKGQDEGTDEPIFDGDDYYCCPDTGIMELKKNEASERVAG